MEEIQPKTGKFALNFGVILGALSIVFALMLYSMDMQYEQGWGIFLVNVFIMAAVIVIGIIQFKKANEGFLTLTEGIKVGIGIALVAAIIGVVYQQIFMNLIEPDFLENILQVRKAEMIAQNPNMTQEQIANAEEMMKKFSGPGISAAIALIGGLFIGLVISLISSLILKKQRPTY
ncbi:DUF4199 domain-containing protein [Flavobacteriaceae bacterium TP-CH-4]|uniref:DUF4199 domain-containing protein n=1 Tax=Pelagihabitans pacificus TaxID=2696054 RepID=A0A967AS74_9FLAO|nr:DUF4199 domain-containing protein [Pelagihabitans pacificus]NHF59406.1 DUF4199 domain-containing protein [Pelagihabitans pacificus]